MKYCVLKNLVGVGDFMAIVGVDGETDFVLEGVSSSSIETYRSQNPSKVLGRVIELRPDDDYHFKVRVIWETWGEKVKIEWIRLYLDENYSIYAGGVK